MPFNFNKNKHYKIDYVSLFEELNSQNILSDKEIQREFLMRWIEELKHADALVINQLLTREAIKEMNILRLSEPEIFGQPIHYKNTTVVINFRISAINRIISNEDKEKFTEIIKCDEFANKKGDIHWTIVDENVDRYKGCKEPVLIIPFIDGVHRWLLIDGNHRVTYSIKNNIDVRAISIAQQTLIENNLFASSFDKLFYIMNNELQYMYDKTSINKISTEKLIIKSYLVDGKIKIENNTIKI